MNLKLFFKLFLSFVLFTIIGTRTHECGHYVAGKMVGIQSSVHFSFTAIKDVAGNTELVDIYKKYKDQIDKKQIFPLKEKFETLQASIWRRDLYFTIGGPLQTMLTGTIGLLIMIFYRKTFFTATTLNVRQWLFIFLSLFWLRELANCAIMMVTLLFTNKREFSSDEVIIAEYFNWHFMSVTVITALVALIIGLVVTFKFVPASQRKTFIAAGFAGGVTGYILWLNILGPIILP